MLGKSSTDTGSIGAWVSATAGRPSDAERAAKWQVWRTLVHEYIHTLEHPASRDMPGANRTISEGFCEMFTEEALNVVLPGAAGNVGLRTTIEGANYGAPSPAMVGGSPYTIAPDYADYVVQPSTFVTPRWAVPAAPTP